MKEKAYYKQNFGNYATKKNIKSYLMEYLKADAYRTELTDSLKATDDEVKQYYEEHINAVLDNFNRVQAFLCIED